MVDKIPNWVGPAVGVAAAASVVGIAAYLLSRPPESVVEEKKTAKEEEKVVVSPYNIRDFIAGTDSAYGPKGNISFPSDNTVLLSHDGDEVSIICPYKYSSATFSRHDKIQESGKKTTESDSTTTLYPGQFKTVHLTEQNRNVDIIITIVAAVEAPLSLVSEHPHGSWKYRIYLTADGNYSYSIIDPAGTESSLRSAANADDAALKAKAEIEAAGGTAPTVTEVYTPPPLSQRLKIVSDEKLRGYRMIVYQTVPGGEHNEMLPTEAFYYWSVTRPDGSVVGPNGADSIEQAKTVSYDTARAEIPATTETIMYKNYKIDLTENLSTTPSYYAKVTYPNGQYVPSAATGNTKDECLAKAKTYIDPLAAADASQAAALAAAAKAQAEALAKGKVSYEYNRYTLSIEPHRMGRYGIIYSPALNKVGETNPYLTEAEVKNEANKTIDAHWASLTAPQQQAEITAYNKRKGIVAPPPPIDKNKAEQDRQRAVTRTAIINQLNTTGQSAYKNHKLVRDGNSIFIYDPSGAKLPTAFQSTNPTGENNINAVMVFIDTRTGSGTTGYIDSRWDAPLWKVKGGRIYVQGESNTFRKGPPWPEIEANIPERKWPYPAEYYPHSPFQTV
jgi:hypothetical protein